jgi:hypothetical protein
MDGTKRSHAPGIQSAGVEASAAGDRRTVRPSEDRLVRSHRDIAELARQCAVIAFPEHTAKRLANAGNITPAAGKKVVRGENGMSLGTFINCCLSSAAFQAAARRLVLMNEEQDPDMERFMSAALQAWQATKR